MNSIERIQATLAGESVDRPAVVPILSLYGMKVADNSPERYYTEPETYVAGQKAVMSAFAPDLILGPFAFALLGAAFGSELAWVPNQAPNLRRTALSRLDQWQHIAWPSSATHPHLRYFSDSLRGLKESFNGRALVATCLPLPTDLPPLIIGMDLWTETLLFDPDGVSQVMDRVIPFFLQLVHDHIAAGADLIVGTSAFTSPTVLTRELVLARVRPHLETMLSQLKAPVIVHHGGSTQCGHLDLLVDLPSVCGFVLDERDSVLEARNALGPAPALLIGPLGPRLSTLSAKEVERQCRVKLNSAGDDPRIILCNSGPDIPLETPAENIRAMFKAASSCGGTP
jgi:uroporphyrinogen decarboxylase